MKVMMTIWLFHKRGIIKITQAILDKLTEEAKASVRLRMKLDLMDSDTDGSQRMLNAIEPESIIPIHRHQKTSETMVCLKGKLRVEYYDEHERICSDSFVIESGGFNVAVCIPIGVWHTAHALESGTRQGRARWISGA